MCTCVERLFTHTTYQHVVPHIHLLLASHTHFDVNVSYSGAIFIETHIL
jgi:hypothetical protein